MLLCIGYVSEIDALVCGCVTHRLGSGRHSPDDDIDYTAGLKLLVSVGCKVNEGKPFSFSFSFSPREIFPYYAVSTL